MLSFFVCKYKWFVCFSFLVDSLRNGEKAIEDVLVVEMKTEDVWMVEFPSMSVGTRCNVTVHYEGMTTQLGSMIYDIQVNYM